MWRTVHTGAVWREKIIKISRWVNPKEIIGGDMMADEMAAGYAGLIQPMR